MSLANFACIVFGLMVSIFITGCSKNPEQDSVSNQSNLPLTIDPGKQQQLENKLGQILEWHGITGMAVAVLQDGQPTFVRYLKHANVEQKTPVTKNTIFQLSSTSKIFTGITLMKLVESGSLSLEDSIGKYLSDLPVAWRDVKVREVLAHTSGLPEILKCDLSSEEVARDCVDRMVLSAAPNAKHSYNQTNAYLVQKIIETVSEKPFAQTVGDFVLQPAGMTSSLYEGNSDVDVANRASSYYPDGKGGLTPRVYNFPVFLYAGAGLNSTLSDLISFSRALHNEDILSAANLQKMFVEPRLTSGDTSNYALGWVINHHADGSYSAGHEGGNLTTYRVFPETGLTVIVLVNGSKFRIRPDEISVEIARILIPSLSTKSEMLLDDMKSASSGEEFEKAIDIYEQFKANSVTRDENTENIMNDLGYDLLARREQVGALEIFRLNVRDYPNSVNVHDSLAETLMAVGKNDLAKAEWLKVLKLDPSYTRATEMLEQIATKQ